MLNKVEHPAVTKSRIKRKYLSDKPINQISYYWYWINFKIILFVLDLQQSLADRLTKRTEFLASKIFGKSDFFKSIKN